MNALSRRSATTLAAALLLVAVTAASHAADIGLGFTGISVDVQGAEGVDYVVERLWYDTETDDDVVIYMHADVPIAMSHNQANIVAAKTPWEPGMDPGTIVVKVDGDGLRGYDGNIYHAAPAYGNPINPPLNEIQFQYAAPFTLAAFKGQVGQGPDFHRGMLDDFGDEWHVLTFWDVDPENTSYQRDDQSNDGKIVLVVLDPQTPVISLGAPAGEAFYTTPAKLYYTPHIHRRTTYLTSGAVVTLTNITSAEPIRYRVDGGPWQDYTTPLPASTLFDTADSTHTLDCRLGDAGPVRTRTFHYESAQPTAGEVHPRMMYKSPEALAADQAVVAAGGPAADEILDPGGWINMPNPPIDFRTGLRYLRANLYRGGYYYQTKNIATSIREYARLGVLQQDETLMRRAVDGLLFLYTIDPIGGESADSRYGGPCQERCMYSDGRVTIPAPAAYDLLAGFTRQAGYAQGMTPIEHIKVRDNLAGEACMMLKYPSSIPAPFWRTTRDDGSPRHVQLESFIAALAMAVPTYDSIYYGTSGADGVTEATHLWAPFDDCALAWITINNAGYVEHPSDPSRFRYSALWNLVAADGAYVGQPRDGYLDMMHQDVIGFLIYRSNFDAFHYPRFQNYLRMRIRQRYPHNGRVMPQAFYGGGYNNADGFLHSLVRSDFPDAALYRWALEHPVSILDTDDLADPTIAPAPPATDSVVRQSYAVLSSDPADPEAVMMRLRVFPPEQVLQWTFQTYLGGAFNIAGYGERLAIEKAGYGRVASYNLGISQQRKNCIMINGLNNVADHMVRGRFTRSLLTPAFQYAEMQTDLASTSSNSSYVQTQTDLTRRAIFIDRRLFLVADTLSSATGEHQFDWLLHGATGGNTDGDAFTKDNAARTAVWTRPSGVRLWTKMISPADFNDELLYETDYIDKNDSTGQPEPYLRARTTGAAVDYLALLYPLDAGAAAPVVTDLQITGGAAVAVTGGMHAGTLVIALRTGAGRLEPAGDFRASSDARICIYKLDATGTPEFLAVVDGTDAALAGSPLAFSLDHPAAAVQHMEAGAPALHVATEVGLAGASLLGWSAVAEHGPRGPVALPMTDGYVECRAGGPAAIRITLDMVVDEATLAPGSVSLTSPTLGDLSAHVASLSTLAGGTVIEVALTGPLSDGHRYTVALDDAVRATGNTPISGDKSLDFAVLAGDLDGSGAVTEADVAAVRPDAGPDVTVATARGDVDRSGARSGADLIEVRNRLGNALP